MTSVDPLADFHPAVRTWFARRFPDGPTEAQTFGWRPIAEHLDTLIAAPTGSGKTLAAFLVAIDRCLRETPCDKAERHGTSVVYVSPLRALTVDIKENLATPLAEITEIASELGIDIPDIRVAVRNGDTPPSERAAMLRNRPEIVVTTPESLYLLLTARRGRELLAHVDTVIIDEIHAIARDKRGAHLAITLERLDRLTTAHTGRHATRIGCSATQRPIETIARLLVGSGEDRSGSNGEPKCAIVDVGHRRALDVAIALTDDELGAVTSSEQLGAVVKSLAEEIRRHQTTLVFVNTRKMSERIAHLLVEELGEEIVTAHHGSLSTERRLSVERRLRAGELAAVVATASLELGIDVGPVELVCQVGSPRSIATFLQRVGRAEHRRDGVPKGRLYPLTRDELVECVALLGAVHAGSLDKVEPPDQPLDILTQQIVAECAACDDDGITEDELFDLIRHATPYRSLERSQFDEAVALMSEGVTTGRGQRGAYLHRDRVHGIVRPRRGARLAAATSGGAIPELANYRVVMEPDDVVVGTVHEDFAVEAMIGDVFLLGSTPWRVRRVIQDTVRVVDAAGASPTIPFWLGEAPARTNELADAVSELFSIVLASLDDGGVPGACKAVRAWAQINQREAEELIAYLATARNELGTLPSKDHLIFERFFDDTGGMQLVVHSPYGARINRGVGLALRKRFCRTFDFELQAAASDDAIVLSFGPQHSFALEEVPRYLHPDSLRETLVQAVLPTPIFTSRWRWNLSRSLLSPRFRGSRHLPFAIQRMEADDLMAAIFPALAACQESATGPVVIPEHLIVRQTLDDCMTEALDLNGATDLVAALRDGSVRTRCIDTTEPSVLCHEIVNGRPYTFLDDAPLEERRTRAVSLRRGIPIETRDLSELDASAVDEVRQEIVPVPRDKEELHDLLCTLVLTTALGPYGGLFDQLVAEGRAFRPRIGLEVTNELWAAVERRDEIEAIFADATFLPDHHLPVSLATPVGVQREDAIASLVRGHLEFTGPVDEDGLVASIATLGASDLEIALARLEAEGAVLRVQHTKWCARRIAARIHARHREHQRARYPALSVAQFMSFLFEWQHVAVGHRLHGSHGVAEIIAQLQGVEVPVGAWEESVLAARIEGYHAQLLDELCAQGEVTWGRLSPKTPARDETARRSGSTPSRATPVALVRREDLRLLLAAARGEAPTAPLQIGITAEIIEALEQRGALFFSDLCATTGRLPIEVGEGLWDTVARGLVSADSFQAVRALLGGRYRHASSPMRRSDPRGLLGPRVGRAPRRLPGTRNIPPALAGGRWSLLDVGDVAGFEPDEIGEAVAAQLLDRWGVVFRDVVQREQLSLPWREILFALRRFEARGIVRGGYFVTSFAGEQFALPGALDALRSRGARPGGGDKVRISAADPLNLTGILFAGARVPAVRGQVLSFVDGVPSDEEAEASAPPRVLAIPR